MTKATKMENITRGKGGVAIIYNKKLENKIFNINRKSHRLITKEIKTEIQKCNIKIICTYAPHMGYASHIMD